MLLRTKLAEFNRGIFFNEMTRFCKSNLSICPYVLASPLLLTKCCTYQTTDSPGCATRLAVNEYDI